MACEGRHAGLLAAAMRTHAAPATEQLLQGARLWTRDMLELEGADQEHLYRWLQEASPAQLQRFAYFATATAGACTSAQRWPCTWQRPSWLC